MQLKLMPLKLNVILLATTILSACTATRQPVSGREGGHPFLVTVWASVKCVQPGDTLIARATVVNNDSITQVVELTDRPVFDLLMGYRTSEGGSTILRWSDGKALTPDLTRMELKPGESKSLELRWVVIDPPPSSLSVAATFVDDLKFIDHPLSPYIAIYGPSACPGPFGP